MSLSDNPIGVVPAKSAGVAVLLSLLWLGAGHLYAGRIGTGIALIVFDLLLAVLALTGIGLVIAFPVWLMAFLVTAVLAANAASAFNRRNGIVVR